MKIRLLTVLLLFSTCPSFLMAQSTWEEHGKLEVSANGHYIQYNDGTPFLWIGDTDWGMIQQLSPNLDMGKCAVKFAAVPNAFGIAHQQISPKGRDRLGE